MIIDVLLDATVDCLKELPFLFAAFLLLEALEHHTSERMNRALSGAGKLGPLVGAVLGCVPQCGFSIMASDFFAGGVITLGTLLAVFLSTSDEAVIILLSNPGHVADVGRLIGTKIIIALIAGYGVYAAEAFYHRRHPGRRKQIKDLCEDCGCHDDENAPKKVQVASETEKRLETNKKRSSGTAAAPEHGHGPVSTEGSFHTGGFRHIIKPAIRHTTQVFIFMYIFSIIIGFLMEWIGIENVSKLFLSNTVFQPLIASLVGLIPNCAASVMLTELYLEGVISFGSAVAGLCSAAGLGLAVLFRINRDKKEALRVTGILTGISCVAGILLQII